MKASITLAASLMALGTAAHAQTMTLEEALKHIPMAKRTLQVHLPRAKEYRFPNGLKLLVLENHTLPTVSISMRLKAGSFFEPASKQGLASMTASMLDEGTRTRTSAQIANAIDAMGASLGAGAAQGGEGASASVSGLSDNTEALLKILTDVVRNPTFPAEQFAKVKTQTVAGLLQENKDPNALAELVAMRTLYGNTPPARVLPTITQVKSLTRQDLIAFHGAYYRPERATIGVSGDVNAETMRRLVAKAFGDWKKGTKPVLATLPAYKPQSKTAVTIVDRPGSVQSVLLITNLGINRTNADYPALTVLNHILGGSETSRIWKNIRETKGYAYDVGTGFTAPRYPGYWQASGQVRNAVTGDAVKEMVGEFQRIEDEPVSDDELAGAKQSIVGKFARQLENPGTLLGYALDIVEYGLPADYWDTYPAKIQAVSKSDLQRVARKYIGTGRAQIIAVGQRSEIEPALAAFGPVMTVDPVQ